MSAIAPPAAGGDASLQPVSASGASQSSPALSALLQRPLEHRPPLQSASDPHAPHAPREHVPTLQSESDPQEPHRPLEHVPFPRQSESEPHDPHRPLEHVPNLQSASAPHAPHLPPEHLPWPLQSASEPHAPHRPFEHLPTPAQSESEPQLADAVPAPAPIRPATNTTASIALPGAMHHGIA